MPGVIPAFQVVGTKISTTDTPKNVRLDILRNGGVVFSVCIPQTDFTSLNTTVNGGSAGATLTLSYAQDTARADYGVGLIVSE
jgi:hypothetical protein